MEEYVHKVKRARLNPQEQPRSNQVSTTIGLGTVIASPKCVASTSTQGILTIPPPISMPSTSSQRKAPTKSTQETLDVASSLKRVAGTSTQKRVANTSSNKGIIEAKKYFVTDLSQNGKGSTSTPTLFRESVTCPSTSRIGTVIVSSKCVASTSSQGISTTPTLTSVTNTLNKKKLSFKPSPKRVASAPLQETLPISEPKIVASTSTMRMMPTITSTPISMPSTSSQRKASTKSTQETLDVASSPKCVAGTSTQKRVANTSSNKGIIKAKRAEAEPDIQRVLLLPCDYDALRECVSHFPKDENGHTMPLLYQSKADMDLFSSKFDALESKNNQKVKKIRAVQIPPYAMIYKRINELKKSRNVNTTVNHNDDFIDKNIAKKVMRQEYEIEKLPREVLENCEKAKIRNADLQLKYISKMLAEKPIDTTYHPNKAREFIKREDVSMETADARKINNQKSRESRMKAKKRLLIYRGSNLFLKEQISDIISQYTMLEEMLDNDEDDGKLMEIISKSHVEDRYEHEFMGRNDDGTQFGSYQPTSQNEISPVEMDSSDEEYYRMPLEVVIKQE